MLDSMRLSPPCARVLGSLVEKALTTPQHYPLTLNSLAAACNQASNREPVVSYDEATVDAALHELKDERLVRFVLPSHGRSVVRYRHVLDEALGLDAGQSAILAMLLLRGAQTVGELRARTERMAPFDGLHGVEHELELLAAHEEPLATQRGTPAGSEGGALGQPVARARRRRPVAPGGPRRRAGHHPFARTRGRRPPRRGHRAPIRGRPSPPRARGAARQPRRLTTAPAVEPATYSGVT